MGAVSIQSIEQLEDADFAAADLPVLDLAYLRQQTYGNAALEIEMLELFLRQSDNLLNELAGSGRKEWRIYARVLKSSAHSIGALAVANIASQAEGVCDKAPARMEALLKSLESAVRKTNEHIRQHLKADFVRA